MIHLIISAVTMLLTCFGLVRCREEQALEEQKPIVRTYDTDTDGWT